MSTTAQNTISKRRRAKAIEPESTPPKRKAVSYLRFSTPEQASGSSEARQNALTLAHCERMNLELVKGYHDPGKSAFRGSHRKRGQFGDFMRAVEDGTIPRGTVLIVESFDRLSREDVPVALQRFLKLINEHEIEIHILALGPTPAIYAPGNVDQLSLMMAIMEMGRAFGESARKSQLISAAWEQLRLKGKPIGKRGGRPMGKHPSWLRWKNGEWEIIEERAAVVRRIFDLAVKHRLGRYDIAVRLVAETAHYWGTGAFWTASGVKRALDNPAVTGRLEPRKSRKKDQIVEGYYPALISHADYEEAQRVIQARKSGGGRPRKTHSEALLSGITWARGCRVHRGYAQQTSGKHQLTYAYVFRNRNSYLTTGAKLEHMVLTAFEKMIDQDLSARGAETQRQEITESIRQFEALRAKSERAISDFLDAIGDSQARRGRPMPELLARLSEAEAARDNYTARILALESQRELLPTDAADSRRRLLDLRESALAGDADARSEVRSLLHRMVQRIDVARTDWPSWADTFPEDVDRFGLNAVAHLVPESGVVLTILLRNGRFFYCGEIAYSANSYRYAMLRASDWKPLKEMRPVEESAPGCNTRRASRRPRTAR